MPFNIWCNGCEQHIARGVRFNAEKRQVGAYYSTTIWAFRMKCHLCGSWFEIQTDPKNSEYVVTEGARRKTEGQDGEASTSGGIATAPPQSVEEALKMQANPFFRLEHRVVDEKRAQEMVPKLSSIQTVNEKIWRYDYDASRLVRQKFRQEKKAMREETSRMEALKSKLSINHLSLLPERPEDTIMARNVLLTSHPNDPKQESLSEAKIRIQKDSIFPKNKTNNSTKKLSFTDDLKATLLTTDALDFAPKRPRRRSQLEEEDNHS